MTATSRARVLVVGRRFWPHGGYAEAIHLAQLAVDLTRRGMLVEVACPRYSRTWAPKISLGGLAVHRPVAFHKSEWDTTRYTRQWTQWLRTKCPSFDVVLVDSIRQEAVAAIEAARMANVSAGSGRTCGTVLRLGGYDHVSDDQWWDSSRSSRRCAVIGRMADRVVVQNASQTRTLLANDYSPSKIHQIDLGICRGPKRSTTAIARARATLSKINSDLATRQDSVVLLTTARMSAQSGIFALVDTARRLVNRFPSLQLWLVGDGPARDKIYSTLRGEGIRGHVAMPGSFCQFDELLMASDIYLHCGHRSEDSILRYAISSGLPSLVCDSQSNRQFLRLSGVGPSRDQDGDPHGVWWYVGDEPGDLRRGVGEILQDPVASVRRADSLKKRWLKQRPESRTLDQYESLLNLSGQRPTNPTDAKFRRENQGTNP